MGTTSVAEGEAAEARPPPPPPHSVDSRNPEKGETKSTVVERFRHQVDGFISKTDELEQRVNEVAQFYANKKQPNSSKGNSVLKDKDKEKPVVNSGSNNNVNNSGSNNGIKNQMDGCRKEAVCSKKMQEVMRQFGTILRQISQHKWAWPFMQPVDVEGLGLHDYYEVIKKPMDFTTIRNQMEASGYKNVREIYADVRLVFTNAMTYNEDKSDVHVMAKTLLEKFEEKWLQLLPKVIEAETRQKEEEARALANMQIAQEAAIAKMARDTNNELNELNLHLEKLKELVVQRCRKMSTEEKKKLGVGLSTLSPEDINKALEIIAQDNPNFQATAEEVDIDMDAQSESTLWRLKFFVKGALELQAKNCASKADDMSKPRKVNQAKNCASKADDISKRKKVIYDALAKTARKRNKKLSS